MAKLGAIMQTRSKKIKSKEEFKMAVKEVTGATFESEVLLSDKPVLVDFWAPWCSPCRMVGPIVEEVSQEVGDRAKVVKVNVDNEPEIAAAYRVMSIPTLIVFENGDEKDREVGLRPKQALLDMLK
jgi:thioredoxin 1